MENNNKLVGSEVYSREYLTGSLDDAGLGGWEIYRESGGMKLPKRLKICLDYANISNNHCVLDAGCGRGELTVYVGTIAKKAIGIDYSIDAIELCKETQNNFIKSGLMTTENKVEFMHMSATNLEFQSEQFDRILILDLIEHLNPTQVDSMLSECKRVLKKDGEMIIHTMPNKLFYDIFYKIIRLLSPILMLSSKVKS